MKEVEQRQWGSQISKLHIWEHGKRRKEKDNSDNWNISEKLSIIKYISK